ncbi:MAG: FAD binding domain-containing protein, partial [Gemmatimonadales bacterium]
QSLIPSMNFRLAQPEVLIDLNRVDSLAYIKEESDAVVIGAMTRQRRLDSHPAVATRLPLLAETMPWVAHPQIRNRGTVGGSLAHADPASELPAVMTALGAEFVISGEDGNRSVPANEFFTGLFGTAMEPTELLKEIRVPAQTPGSGWAFEEVARRHGDFALVGVAVNMTVDAQAECRAVSVVLLSVGGGPVDAIECAAALRGSVATDDLIDEAAGLAAEQDIDPPADIHASASYRRQLARVLTRRTLRRALARCSTGE